jgi:hypothetical protein
MGVSRQTDEKVQALLDLLSKDQRWLIVINAAPDAMGAAHRSGSRPSFRAACTTSASAM